MAFMFVHGHCAACDARIAFNADHVPSLRLNGTREPLCRPCALRWNELHPDRSKPIHPDAYEPQEVPG